jgi:hypothetical protein
MSDDEGAQALPNMVRLAARASPFVALGVIANVVGLLDAGYRSLAAGVAFTAFATVLIALVRGRPTSMRHRLVLVGVLTAATTLLGGLAAGSLVPKSSASTTTSPATVGEVAFVSPEDDSVITQKVHARGEGHLSAQWSWWLAHRYSANGSDEGRFYSMVPVTTSSDRTTWQSGSFYLGKPESCGQWFVLHLIAMPADAGAVLAEATDNFSLGKLPPGVQSVKRITVRREPCPDR